MEIIYPNDFIRFFNDNEEIDEVGEFEILPEESQDFFERYYNGPVDIGDINNNYIEDYNPDYRSNYNYIEDYSPYYGLNYDYYDYIEDYSPDYRSNYNYIEDYSPDYWFNYNYIEDYSPDYESNYNYIEDYRARESESNSKFSIIPPAVKDIPDNIANIPAVVQDLPYAIKDMGHDFVHSAPVSYVANMLPAPTNWQNPQSPSPLGPPPSHIPSKQDAGVQHATFSSGGGATKAVSPGSIRNCLFRFTYIWQNNGRSYWAYLTRVDRRSVSGWRWAGFRWVFFGVDLRRIDSFVCF
ncbi:hypothetical protein [Clostridium sp. LIBA-8841]|uniref:hypothetical protein n=1 Tax=Clostridium sp. LIBA-8841 TaxID=2987530 RepID=UPI002AC45AAA|nr:hypothetical protein [Clostridium sp. LIBA-8841]MDZ5254763.1 hypothetical protein [Clostridium sp. LIBA-8841]